MQNLTDYLVVGAGISGLTIAYLLKKKGFSVRVIEQEARIGGCIVSEKMGGYLADFGPNSLLKTNPKIQELVESLGLENLVEPASALARSRFILRNGKIKELPTSPSQFILSDFFSTKAKIRLFAEPFIGRSQNLSCETLAEFVKRRLGQEFLDFAIDPFVAGVFAGKAENLSVAAAFPKLAQLETQYGSLIKGAILGSISRFKSKEVARDRAKMISFSDGMSTLIDSLAVSLNENILLSHRALFLDYATQEHPSIKMETPEGLTSYQGKKIVLTLPASGAAQLINNMDTHLANELHKIYYPPVAVVFQGFKREQVKHPLKGFGFLVPSAEKAFILGTLWNSSLFKNRSPENTIALTSFVGGSRLPAVGDLSINEIEEKTLKDVQNFLEIKQDPTFQKTRLWPHAIPQYDINHDNRIKLCKQFEERFSKIAFLANYRGGISMSDCIKNAYALSESF